MSRQSPDESDDSSANAQRLSYKFQRLRERIRNAIASGELAGKLPGERELAKRFKVNTKTLSKALTELAADGLVERSIGLGTFVRGSESRRETLRGLVVGSERIAPLLKSIDSSVVDFTTLGDSLEPLAAAASRFDCIVIASERLPAETVRDLVLRGKRVVTIGSRIPLYASRSLLLDEASAAAMLTQRLVHRGHRNVLILGYDSDGEILAAARSAIGESGATVKVGQLIDLQDALSNGTTGLIVLPPFTGRQAIEQTGLLGYTAPKQISILAVGWSDVSPACSGLYVPAAAGSAALLQLIEHHGSARPVSLWLTGSFIDTGTLGQATP